MWVLALVTFIVIAVLSRRHGWKVALGGAFVGTAAAPLRKLPPSTLYLLAAMFLVFAVWAAFGFSYPLHLLPFACNAISKILSFAAAITLFVPEKAVTSTSA